MAIESLSNQPIADFPNEPKSKKNLSLILAGTGILLFLAVTFSFSFKDQLNSLLYPKPLSRAQSLPSTLPSSNLTGNINNSISLVTLTKSGFSPATLTIKANSRVAWVNNSGQAASVNSNDHPTHKLYPPLNLGLFNSGSSVQLVFDKAGTYKYHNHLNPAQTGTIIVQ